MTDLRETLLARFAQNGEDDAVLLGRAGALSYRQLATAVSAFQARLQKDEAKALGVLSTRHPAAYIMVLAAVLSGIRFVPLNPDLPADRLRKIIDLAGIDLVGHDNNTQELATALGHPACDVTSHLEDAKSAEKWVVPDLANVSDDQIAYQMFTSGSTGDPKGVPISYANLSHYVTTIIAALDLPQGRRFSQLFDLSFDLSLHDIFVCFATGGLLCPASKIDLLMPHSYIAKKRIEVWFSVPMIAAMVTRGQDDQPPEHKVDIALFCGEPLPFSFAKDFMAFVQPDGALYNLYGPTEATIAITAKRFDPAQIQFNSVPIGTPFGQNLIAIEHEDGHVTPIKNGAEGELLLGGPQVFAGYSPAVGTDVFVSDGVTHFYRSGDIVRVENGDLIHLGRNDAQIKLRGYRIELGDIEAAARKGFGCDVVCAVVLGDEEDKSIGLAYASDTPIDDVSSLETLLPAYMLPRQFLCLPELPVNVNGKIDRKALKAMSWPA